MFMLKEQNGPILSAPFLDVTQDLMGVHLSWTAVPGATQYVLEINGIDLAPVTGLSVTSTFAPGSYTFRVRGYRPVGVYGPYSVDAFIVVEPITLQITPLGGGVYDFQWVDSSPVGDMYELYVSTNFGPFVLLDTILFGVSSYNRGLPYFQRQEFRLDRITPGASSNTVIIRPLPDTPPPPGFLYATPNLLDPNTSIDLNWTTVLEAQVWWLEYSENNFDFFPAPTPAIFGEVLSYTMLGLNPNTTYYFRIRAENDLGFSDWSYAEATTADGIPRTPILLSATQNTSVLPNAEVDIEWLDNSDNETAFTVWRISLTYGGPPQIVGTYASGPGTGTTISELDTFELADGVYQYYIIAENMTTGNSYQSNRLEVTVTGTLPFLGNVTAIPAIGSPTNIITASWPPVRGATQLRVAIKDVITDTFVFGPTAISTTLVNWSFFSLTPATEYRIIVVADNANGQVVDDDTYMWTLPLGIDGFQVVGIKNSAAAMLLWTDLGGSVEMQVQILRRPMFGSFTVIATLTPNNNTLGSDQVRWFIDANTLSGQMLEYQVKYLNPAPYGPDETYIVPFTAPIRPNVAPAYVQAFNSRRFNQMLPPTFPINEDSAFYYLASYFNPVQITITGLAVIADIVATPSSKAGFFFKRKIEYCTRSSLLSPWETVATLATINAFSPPDTNAMLRFVVEQDTITSPAVPPLLQGGPTVGYLVNVPIGAPVIIPPGTQFCIRVKVDSYEFAGLNSTFNPQITDQDTIIRTFNVDPANGYTGSIRNLGPYLASTGGEIGIVQDLPGPQTPLVQTNTEVPQVFITLVSP